MYKFLPRTNFDFDSLSALNMLPLRLSNMALSDLITTLSMRNLEYFCFD